jgi:putative glutathione S-transferase
VSAAGEFERAISSFRDCIAINEIAKNRYHLYVSYACPWAHRTLITRNIKGLQDIINVSVTEPYMGEKGCTFSLGKDLGFLSELYLKTDPNFTGRITVHVLWDKKTKTIINNESSEIIRILNSAFDDMTDSDIDLYPEFLRNKINAINDKIYHNVINGVYKCGFAQSQTAYEKSFDALFKVLDELNELLGKERFLTGNYFTEADIRLFTTLFRFDPVYVGHFKCNKKRIVDYPNLHSYLKMIYQLPAVKSTCRLDHIKEHYFTSHRWINPSGIIPKGPDLDIDSAHNRGEVNFWRSRH